MPETNEIQSLGGKARAESLSKADRSAIAKGAAEARWLKAGKHAEIPIATHGSPDRPLRVGDLEIPCYVLADGRRVLVQRGMLTSLDMKQGTAGRGGAVKIGPVVGSRQSYRQCLSMA